MELGQTVCTVTQPNCPACPLASQCLAAKHQSQALAPAAKLKSAAPLAVNLSLVILQHDQLFGLVERPSAARFLQGTAGFLTLIQDDDGQLTGDGWATTDLKRLIGNTRLGKLANPSSPHNKAGNKGLLPGLTDHDVGQMLGRIRHTITHHKIQAEVQTIKHSRRPDLPIRWLAASDIERHLIANLDRKAWNLALSRLIQIA
jgi:adenine-specific DNA glycosylase